MTDVPIDAKKPVDTLFSEKQPCCLEFCPSQPHHFVIGTYNLVDAESQAREAAGAQTRNDQDAPAARPNRDGSLVLCKIEGDHDPEKIIIEDRMETASGILDLHFDPDSGSQRFGVVTSDGFFAIYELHHSVSQVSAGTDALSIRPLHACPLLKDAVITSFAWTFTSKATYLVSITSANKQLRVFEFYEGMVDHQRPQEIVTDFHGFDAWITVLVPALPPSSRANTTVAVLSGGDDAKVMCYELPEGSPPAQKAWEDVKIHGAGVTAILPLRLRVDLPQEAEEAESQHLVLVTGCYDDKIRVLAPPLPDGPRRPTVLAEKDLGGGVWRLRVFDERSDVQTDLEGRVKAISWRCAMLACCMYAGARIVEISANLTPILVGGKLSHVDVRDGAWEIKVRAAFEEHESMCYAGDVVPSKRASGKHGRRAAADHGQNERSFVTTSFYDRRLCLWRA